MEMTEAEKAAVAAGLEEYLEDAEEMMQELLIYDCAIKEVETKFRVLSTIYDASRDSNPIDTIRSRVKTPPSIVEKLQRRNLPVTIESMNDNLTDIAGVRVVCRFVDDIYALADLFLGQDDIRLIERKDYIASPKPNGYRSLHLIIATPVFTPTGKREVTVEIQMRTIAMHFWANLEHHLNYKKDLSDELRSQLSTELFECAQASASLDARMEDVRRKINTYRLEHAEASKRE